MLYASAIDGPDSSGSWDVSGPGDEGAVGRAVGRDAGLVTGTVGFLAGEVLPGFLTGGTVTDGRLVVVTAVVVVEAVVVVSVVERVGGGGADVAALVARAPEDAEGGWGAGYQEARPNVRKRATRRATVLFKKIPANLTILPNSIRQRSGKRKRNFSV